MGCEQANVVDSSGLTAVGAHPEGVSWVGAYDMAGNAMEWVQDWLRVRITRRVPKMIQPERLTGRKRSKKAAGGAVIRMWRGRPISILKTRRRIKITISGFGC